MKSNAELLQEAKDLAEERWDGNRRDEFEAIYDLCLIEVAQRDARQAEYTLSAPIPTPTLDDWRESAIAAIDNYAEAMAAKLPPETTGLDVSSTLAALASALKTLDDDVRLLLNRV